MLCLIYITGENKTNIVENKTLACDILGVSGAHVIWRSNSKL